MDLLRLYSKHYWHYMQFISYRTYNSLNFYYMNLTDNREPETQRKSSKWVMPMLKLEILGLSDIKTLISNMIWTCALSFKFSAGKEGGWWSPFHSQVFTESISTEMTCNLVRWQIFT